MSLYGQVKRIGSSSFQFDKIYNNRKEMDAAVEIGRTDGVHIGRYVLIEYGERYEAVQNENQENVYIDGKIQIKETDNFLENYNIDINAYHATYDSTVWQKIYVGNKESYIMIAELNAAAPRLHLVAEDALIYQQVNELEQSNDLYDKNNIKINGLQEQYSNPYFDDYTDTELTYNLHLPKLVQLEVDQNKSINYNENGFNVFYATNQENTESYIHWLIQEFEADAEGHVNTASENQVLRANKKTLSMNIPAFGNSIIQLYNILYGAPSYELTEAGEINKYTDGIYKGEPKIGFAKVIKNNELVFVWQDSNGTFFLQNNPPTSDQDGVVPPVTQIRDGLRSYFKQYREKYPYIVNAVPVPSNAIHNPNTQYVELINGLYYKDYIHQNTEQWQEKKSQGILYTWIETDELRHAGNDNKDKYFWCKDVPLIDKILQNNTAGLITLLSDIIGVHTLDGVQYWLLNDWTAEEWNIERNTPTIRNKPKVVTANQKTIYRNFDEVGFFPDGTHANVKAFVKGLDLTSANENEQVQIPIDNSTGQYLSNSTTKVNAKDYSFYNVEKPIESEEYFSNGHWYLDIDNWQLQAINLPTKL